MLGVRQKDVRVGTMENGVLGVHATIGGKSGQIILNSKYFDLPKAKIETMQKQGMKDGWHTKTKKPVQHTVIHELAHATWNNHLDSANAKAATPAVKNSTMPGHVIARRRAMVSMPRQTSMSSGLKPQLRQYVETRTDIHVL